MKRITSLQHPIIKHLVKLRKERSYRYGKGTALIEGRKLASEIPAKLIVTTNENEPLQADEILLVTPEVMQKISGMQSPEGIAAEVTMAHHPLEQIHKLLVLDGISDPGNLGVLLRTALALGWSGAFLLEGCCDPYNDKALTAARGATFKLPFQQGTWDDLQSLADAFQLKPYVAEMKGTEAKKLLDEKMLLVLGNEARGPSEQSRSRCQAIAIPISNEMESLNVAVAGGILMYIL